MSDYYYKLDAKLKVRYLEMISFIGQEDPYEEDLVLPRLCLTCLLLGRSEHIVC